MLFGHLLFVLGELPFSIGASISPHLREELLHYHLLRDPVDSKEDGSTRTNNGRVSITRS